MKKGIIIYILLFMSFSCFNTKKQVIDSQETEYIEEIQISELDGAQENEQYYIDGLQFIEYSKDVDGDSYCAIYNNNKTAIIPFSRKIEYFSECYAYFNGVRQKIYIGRSTKYGDELFDAKFNTIIKRRKDIDISIVTNQNFSYAHIYSDDYEGAIGIDGRKILDINSKEYESIELNELDNKHLYFETWNDGVFELYDLDGRFIIEAKDYWVSFDDNCIYYDTLDGNSRKIKIKDIINDYNVGK